MLNDFFAIFFWWVLLFGLGLVCFPLSHFFFHRFWDRGYALAKIIGLLLVSYLIWLLGSLKILPFLTGTIWLVILLVGVANFWLKKKQKLDLKKIFGHYRRIFALEELFFFVPFAFWAFIRGFQPNIEGLEKFMDYGFVNSALRSQSFPPADMWLAGKTINYYYFGHLMTAVLTKLSGIDSAITYNLMMATLCGLTFSATFCLGSNLIFLNEKSRPRLRRTGIPIFSKAERSGQITKHFKPKILIAGFLSALLVTFGGNLHTLYWFLKNGNFKAYWYPDATRFIVEKFGAADNTIHEFPMYSFVVADLHGHLLDLPLVLLLLGIILALFSSKKIPLPFCLFASLLLGVFYMTNAWDFPVYLLILGFAILTINWLSHGFKIKTLFHTASLIGYCIFFAVLFSLPFHLNFDSIAQGISLVDFHSPAWMLLVLWGFPLFVTLSFLFSLNRPKLTQKLLLFFRKKTLPEAKNLDYLVIILLGVSWLLIFIPEVIYLKDIYIHSHQRANTMFKLTYQSFVMFYLATPYIIIKTLSILKSKSLKFLLLTSYFLLLTFIFVYPYFATRSYYTLKEYRGLYGLDYLRSLYPDDYEAVVWLKANINGQSVIVEAVGESYTTFARVSANTGLPTILGWRVHEWLWRGSFDEAGKRTEEVAAIYQSNDMGATKQLLNKYRAQFIFVGQLEREQYLDLNEEKLDQLGEVIFSSGKTKIYQLKTVWNKDAVSEPPPAKAGGFSLFSEAKPRTERPNTPFIPRLKSGAFWCWGNRLRKQKA